MNGKNNAAFESLSVEEPLVLIGGYLP